MTTTMVPRIDRDAPEYKDVDTFIAFVIDDDRDWFYPGEAQVIALRTRKTLQEVIAILRTWGLKPRIMDGQRPTRGVNSNPNGTHPFQANPTFTTSGTSSIMGLAGNAGN